MTVGGTAARTRVSASPGISVELDRLTVSRRRLSHGRAGATYSLNAGALRGTQIRITRRPADSGGGIADYGTLSLHASLVDKNAATALGGGTSTAPSTAPRTSR